MKNLDDSSKAPAEVPSSIKNSETAKLRAIKLMLQELRAAAVKNGTDGKFWLLAGFTEATIDRMMQSDEGDEFSWLDYVTERTGQFEASFDVNPKNSLREMLDEAYKTGPLGSLTFGSKRMF
ncbi:MAG: hypothetical protein LCH91_13980 [Bacteroidetes bacterium]|nr:hypothetical protein [Bacteroidota bacterium]